MHIVDRQRLHQVYGSGTSPRASRPDATRVCRHIPLGFSTPRDERVFVRQHDDGAIVQRVVG